MDWIRERRWLWTKQGLDGSSVSDSTAHVIARSGWLRSVGGVNPYFALLARNEAEFPSVENDAQLMEVYELPSARGCTYVVPKEHFGIALSLAQGTIDEAPMKTATKFLGVTNAEIDRLQQAILEALRSGPKKPEQLKAELGDAVRSLGEDGKKRGQASTLSLGLAPLQVQGKIVRVPVGGGFVTQKYAYRLWPEAKDIPAKEDAETNLAELY